MSYSEYLYKLLEFENVRREQRGKQIVLKMAGLPKLKTIDTFDYKSSSVDKTLINVTGKSYRLKQKREAGLLDISNK